LPSLTPLRYQRRLEAASDFTNNLIGRFDCVKCAIEYYKASLDSVRAFYANDLRALETAENQMQLALGSKKFFEAVVGDRNVAIVDTVNKIFKQKEERSIVIFLGAAHLIGFRGVPNLLKENGFIDCP
jgi:uncharacterized protein YbaP (TraB family)